MNQGIKESPPAEPHVVDMTGLWQMPQRDQLQNWYHYFNTMQPLA
jgi:hypothetical protein